MAVSYNRLWHRLIDLKMKKKDLQAAANLTQYAMRQLRNDKTVTTEALEKVCRALNCKVDDIMEVIDD